MSITGKPVLTDDRIDKSVEEDSFVRQLQAYHGVGSVIPDNTGGTTAVRLNLNTGKLEYQHGNNWKEVQ